MVKLPNKYQVGALREMLEQTTKTATLLSEIYNHESCPLHGDVVSWALDDVFRGLIRVEKFVQELQKGTNNQ